MPPQALSATFPHSLRSPHTHCSCCLHNPHIIYHLAVPEQQISLGAGPMHASDLLGLVGPLNSELSKFPSQGHFSPGGSQGATCRSYSSLKSRSQDSCLSKNVHVTSPWIHDEWLKPALTASHQARFRVLPLAFSAPGPSQLLSHRPLSSSSLL